MDGKMTNRRYDMISILYDAALNISFVLVMLRNKFHTSVQDLFVGMHENTEEL